MSGQREREKKILIFDRQFHWILLMSGDGLMGEQITIGDGLGQSPLLHMSNDRWYRSIYYSLPLSQTLARARGRLDK